MVRDYEYVNMLIWVVAQKKLLMCCRNLQHPFSKLEMEAVSLSEMSEAFSADSLQDGEVSCPKHKRYLSKHHDNTSKEL
jgi:hypothetical protein